MKKGLIIFSAVILIGVIGYYLLYKPLQPEKEKSAYEKALDDFKATWNGVKWADFAHLDDQTYIRVTVIRAMLESGELSASDLSAESLALIDGYSQQIEWDPEWLAQVEAQVGTKYSNLEEAIFFNAVWMVQNDGKLNIKA